MRRFKVVTSSSDDDLLDLFTFHVAREHVNLLLLGKGYGFHEGASPRAQARAPRRAAAAPAERSPVSLQVSGACPSQPCEVWVNSWLTLSAYLPPDVP